VRCDATANSFVAKVRAEVDVVVRLFPLQQPQEIFYILIESGCEGSSLSLQNNGIMRGSARNNVHVLNGIHQLLKRISCFSFKLRIVR
jgi:hypothetical protein